MLVYWTVYIQLLELVRKQWLFHGIHWNLNDVIHTIYWLQINNLNLINLNLNITKKFKCLINKWLKQLFYNYYYSDSAFTWWKSIINMKFKKCTFWLSAGTFEAVIFDEYYIIKILCQELSKIHGM